MVKRELAVFLVVGATTVLIDFLAYRSLLWSGLGIDAAKAAGFLAGTVFAYLANRFWTFGHRSSAPGSLWRFALLYGATLAANVGANALALQLLNELPWRLPVAFVLATGLSATLNFLGMKCFVFRGGPAPEAS